MPLLLTPKFHENEDGYLEIDERCADCEYSYIEDIWYEWMCKFNKCPFEKEDKNGERKKV